MKAAIVLLSDYAIQNLTRRMVFELNRRYEVPPFASVLPAHVSLKQPFAFESMSLLEGYFDRLAASIAPFEIVLDTFYCGGWEGYGILGLHVVETPRLRALHNQLNAELKQLFLDTSAPFDGSEYSFHLTIEMGKVSEAVNGFQEYYEGLPNKQANLRFTARNLAMFYYPESDIGSGSFITYRVCPLGGD